MCQSKVDILAVEEVSVAMVFPLAVVVPVKPLMQASAALVTSVLEGAEAAAFGSAVMVLAVFKAAVNMWMDMNKVLPISRANEWIVKKKRMEKMEKVPESGKFFVTFVYLFI